MFKFNFLSDTNDNKDDVPLAKKLTSNSHFEKASLKPYTKQKIQIKHFQLIDSMQCENFKELKWKKIKIKFLNPDTLSHNFKEDGDPSTEHHYDLIPSVYEGGFKIWECTWDLLKYITDNKISFKDKRVLELGCGSGLLGIAAAIDGASHVTLQDYNEEVLDHLTIPNVILNQSTLSEEFENVAEAEERLNSVFEFCSGDWGSFLSHDLPDGADDALKFDVILSSETIYNASNYSNLVGVFEKYLKKNGEIFLASKNYYFGVGGGTTDFLSHLSTKRKFDVSTFVTNNEGLVREILRIKFS